MQILYLGPKSPLVSWLKQGNEVTQTEAKITDTADYDFIISYGYRHIIDKDILDMFPNRAINLHLSYLPWNRGADPNLWSWAEGTPKGVTIHYLDEGVDTGDLIAQRKVRLNSSMETLATSYEKLTFALEDLFYQYWPDIKAETCGRHKQVGPGSIHKTKDKETISHLLIYGWDTPAWVLDDYAFESQQARQFWDRYDKEIKNTARFVR